jgi:hypothetical protein
VFGDAIDEMYADVHPIAQAYLMGLLFEESATSHPCG